MDRLDSAPPGPRAALEGFTQRLVEHFAPEQVIFFDSQVRGEARWDSDDDILVVMPFEGIHSSEKCWITARGRMAEITPLITAWIRFAEEDWDDAQILARSGGKPRSICFLVQHCHAERSRAR